MTTTTAPDAPAAPVAHAASRGRWIEEWEPEDPDFWERTGAKIANRNLWFSILAEHIGFSIWTMWSVLVLFMGPEYGIDPAGKFFLLAVPTLVGAVLRLPYTVAVARFGGRNWTVLSAASLADLHAEKLRQERIEALGIRVVRWGWDDIWKPAAARATAARLHTALRRAAQLSPRALPTSGTDAPYGTWAGRDAG